MNLNQVTLIGRLTQNIEIKKLPSGVSVVNTSMATNHIYYKDEQKVEETDFHSIVAFGKTAEIMQKYLTKGQLINIVGRLKTRNWEDESGKKIYKTEIIIERMNMGPKPAGDASKPKKQETTHDDYTTEEINPDDIPF